MEVVFKIIAAKYKTVSFAHITKIFVSFVNLDIFRQWYWVLSVNKLRKIINAKLVDVPFAKVQHLARLVMKHLH